MGKIDDDLIFDPAYNDYCNECKYCIKNEDEDVCRVNRFCGNYVRIGAIKACTSFTEKNK